MLFVSVVFVYVCACACVFKCEMFVFFQLGRYTGSLEFRSEIYQGLGLYDEGVIPSSSCIGTECKCQGPVGICEFSSCFVWLIS